MLANPTPRQRVDPSSPFYLPSTNPETANPTARQRVDRSSPLSQQRGIFFRRLLREEGGSFVNKKGLEGSTRCRGVGLRECG